MNKTFTIAESGSYVYVVRDHCRSSEEPDSLALVDNLEQAKIWGEWMGGTLTNNAEYRWEKSDKEETWYLWHRGDGSQVWFEMDVEITLKKIVG